MLLSAEARLFWFDAKPADLEQWFLNAPSHRHSAGGPEVRTDVYLRDENQVELGVKTRGNNAGVEVKGLLAILDHPVTFGAYEIPIELWSKWASQTLAFDTKAGVALHKQRWSRKFDTVSASPVELVPASGILPKVGCNVEWTVVKTASGVTCWTLGFEAFGHLQDVEKSLLSVVRIMAERKPPDAPGAKVLSYPAWLSTLPALR